MQCGTVLAASATPIEVYPPRMSRWKKPVRGLFRFFRISGLHLPSIPSMPDWAEKFFCSSLFTAVFSIIPGLAQLLSGQIRFIRWYWVAWAAMIMMMVIFWGTSSAAFFFSLALSIHVWIAMRGGILKDFEEFRHRMAIFSVLAVVYFLIYYHGSQLALRMLGIQGGYSLFNLPSKEIETGHYFWGRTRNFTLQRGDIVSTSLRTIGNHGYFFNRQSEGFVRIIGLPKETLTIREGLFQVNNEVLDKDQFPVPAWLARVQDYSVALGDDQYFVVAEFGGQGYNSGHVNSVCILSSSSFYSKAFLQWQPLRNRGFIESNP